MYIQLIGIAMKSCACRASAEGLMMAGVKKFCKRRAPKCQPCKPQGNCNFDFKIKPSI